MFKVLFSAESVDDLKAIDSKIALQIKDRIDNYLIQAPKELGKQLVGVYRGLYRYRYGNYRIIYEISGSEKIVIINRIGHRSNIYT